MATQNSPQTGAALVVGVGPLEGLGAAVCLKFAQEGLTVHVAGRTEEALQKVVEEIRRQGGKAEMCVMDATDPASVEAGFYNVLSAGEPLRSVVYNAGNNAFSGFLDMTPEFFENLWKVCSFGGMLVSQHAVKAMQAHGEGGSILFTGATASLRARPPFTGFASAKAAERALAHGLAREFGKEGIHVAHVIVDGIVGGDKVRSNFPDFYDSLGEDGVLNIHDMAAAYWMLHTQPRSTWTLELDLRPYKENF